MTAPSPVDRASGATPVPAGDACPHCGHEVRDSWLVCAWCGQALAAPAELPAGTLLAGDRFEVRGVLGRGGFGITYAVDDRRLQRRVAVKELFPESAVRHGSLVLTPPHARPAFRSARERFLREARVLARFNHPGIVRVFEVFEEHGTAYLVMELLVGRTLLDVLKDRGRPFAEDEVLDVGGRVAGAVRAVHAAGVLHRDLNPSNVILTDHGRIVVIDFGLARDFDADRTTGMTRVVTPGYAPLEQYVGEGRFGPPTDVYGLAATLYRLATGRIPVAALEREGGAALPSVHKLNPAISKAVSDAIGDGLEIQPSHRPRNLDELLHRLGLERPPVGTRSILLDRVPPPARTGPSLEPSPAGEVWPPLPVVNPSPPPAPVPPPTPGPDAVPRPAMAPGRPTPVGVDPDAQATELATGYAGAASPPAAPGRPAMAPGRPTPPGTNPDAQATELATGYVRRAPAGPAGPPAEPATGRAPEPVGGTVAFSRTAHLPERAPASSLPAPPPPPARVPLAVGPPRIGRKKVTVPLGAMAVAAISAAPVAGSVAAVVLGLPLLATWGDSVRHRTRQDVGLAAGFFERRAAPGVLAPARFVRNLGLSVVRAIPALAIGAALLAGWVGVDRLDVSEQVADLVLRAVGLVVGAMLVVPAARGTQRFRTGLAVDRWVERWVSPDGKVGQRGLVLWLVAGIVVAGALWLAPDSWPVPHHV